MTSIPMRRLLRRFLHLPSAERCNYSHGDPPPCSSSSLTRPPVRSPRPAPTDPHDVLQDTPMPGSNHDSNHPPSSERTLAIGRTLRILSPLLPNILSTPLPQNILSPSVTPHLFPRPIHICPLSKAVGLSRCPLHRTSRLGTVPFVGNINLKVISERMARTGVSGPVPGVDTMNQDNAGEEKLVVRWITEAKHSNGNTTASASAAASSASAENTNANLSTLLGGSQPLTTNNEKQFSGLFIFTFDGKGRIVSHTIEHADEDTGYDRTSRVVTVADWLLGKARGRKEGEIGLVPGLGVAASRVMPEVVRLAREERARNRWPDQLW